MYFDILLGARLTFTPEGLGLQIPHLYCASFLDG